MCAFHDDTMELIWYYARIMMVLCYKAKDACNQTITSAII